MFEASPGPSEIGAAINICYNADSVLKHIGVNVAEAGGVRLERVRRVRHLPLACADALAATNPQGIRRAAERSGLVRG